MTISDFATKHTISERTVRVWIEKEYIPGANLNEDCVPASARKPYTKARAKTSDAIYCSIVNASRNHFGQCNVSDWVDIVAVSAGHNHTIGLKADGTLVATGSDRNRQCDVSDWTNITTKQPMA